MLKKKCYEYVPLNEKSSPSKHHIHAYANHSFVEEEGRLLKNHLTNNLMNRVIDDQHQTMINSK